MTKKILAIDDHPDTIQLIEMALQRHGYEVIGAFSGPEGLEIAEREKPDLILLDMMMPGMDGNAVCRAIRQNPDIAATPIIMFTAKSQATDKKVSFDAGADDYLTKPTRPSELLQRIQALLSRHEFQPGDDEPVAQTALKTVEPRFITVLGSRGGVGVTTVALNLAATLAGGDVKTILVDLDTRQGHTAIYLGHKVGSDLLDWLAQPAGSLDETLPQYLVEIQDRLLLLPSRQRLADVNPDLRAPQAAALTTILDDTRHTVVVDAGSHSTDALRPLLHRSDTIFVCLRPERAAIVGALQLIEYLPQLVAPEKIQPLLLDYGDSETMPRAAIESFLGQPLCDVIQLDLEEITRAVNRHQPLIYNASQGLVLQHFQRLAHVLETAAKD